MKTLNDESVNYEWLLFLYFTDCMAVNFSSFISPVSIKWPVCLWSIAALCHGRRPLTHKRETLFFSDSCFLISGKVSFNSLHVCLRSSSDCLCSPAPMFTVAQCAASSICTRHSHTPDSQRKSKDFIREPIASANSWHIQTMDSNETELSEWCPGQPYFGSQHYQMKRGTRSPMKERIVIVCWLNSLRINKIKHSYPFVSKIEKISASRVFEIGDPNVNIIWAHIVQGWRLQRN